MFPSDLLPITDNQLLVPSSWLRYQLPARIYRLPAAPCPPTTKKPGAFPSPMPNEFGVCMVYGRCCTEVRRRAPYMSLPSFLPR